MKLSPALVPVWPRDSQGATEADIPPAFEKYGSALVGWNADRIIAAVDGENNFERPDGSTRSPVNAGSNSTC